MSVRACHYRVRQWTSAHTQTHYPRTVHGFPKTAIAEVIAKVISGSYC